ncbi:hypothetical protein [Rubinisphaera italica]|uniref:Uncharacterized protein n=1 Tax=Rubinisphaera italica TaxID=2527969 RepID=A0A5C5XC93_9PLAN|nr:hypothetical protein [Rubinisphaera italica]TWT60757.1 hypothetical protein Pan54_14840 [Rubinisphaera italica]
MQKHRFSIFLNFVCAILLTHASAGSVHAETITTEILRSNEDWVSLFNSESKQLMCFGPRSDAREVIGSNFIDLSQDFRNVPTDRYHVLFGFTENMLYFLNSDTGKLVGYQIKSRNSGIPEFTNNFVHASSIGKNVLMKISPIRNETGTGGVFLFSRETGKLSILYVDPSIEGSVSVILTHDTKVDDKQGLLNLTELKMNLSNASDRRTGAIVVSPVRINLISSKGIIRYRLQYNKWKLTPGLPNAGTVFVEGYYPLGQ